MKDAYHTVRLQVRIYDQAAFFAAAVAHAVADGMSEADARELLTEDADDEDEEQHATGDGKVVNLNACLQMLFDPGTSPDGCEIQESHAEHDYSGEETDSFL